MTSDLTAAAARKQLSWCDVITDETLTCYSNYVDLKPGGGGTLDGSFEKEDIEAMVYWMTHSEEFAKPPATVD